MYLFVDDWKDELKKYIDADNLPEYYGGTGCDDSDPKCSSEVLPMGRGWGTLITYQSTLSS